jgi:SAM-dependent methyltransferase
MDAAESSARQIAEALRNGVPVPDRTFDALLPADVARFSAQYWSPVAVTMLASRWLARDAPRVVDIGSGGGKFCTIGALVTGARFVGIEHRARLVLRARALAECLGVADRVEFVHCDVADFRIEDGDALYLFNPFEENVLPREEWLDDSIEHSEAKFHADIDSMEAAFDLLAVGAKVATYEGFGRESFDGFELLRTAELRGGRLCCWRKVLPRRAPLVSAFDRLG